MIDIRLATARLYDEQPSPYDGHDISFYVNLLPHPNCRVLELGCGTGRVLLPLSAHCTYIHGIDISESMLEVCQEKLRQQRVPPERAFIQTGDITDLDLHASFDLIIAPFRVFQALETDMQVDGFFETVRRHLAPGGSSVLNAFRPYGDRETVLQRWNERMNEELLSWEHPYDRGRLVGYESMRRIDAQRMICYPTLTYRYFEPDAQSIEQLVEQADVHISMRAWYADQFLALIEAHGFSILDKWGGYDGEVYDEGPELVVRFG